MTTIKVGHSYFPKTTPVLPKKETIHTNTSGIKKSFADHLQESTQKTELKFSHHAKVRLEQRGIELSYDMLDRLNSGLQKASEKGAKESLFLLDGMAFVVSVKNQTVITAMEQMDMEEHVITNIDSAVLLS